MRTKTKINETPIDFPSDKELLSRLMIGIGEVSRISDVPIRQLRYWEAKGIITPVEPGATVRRYDFPTIKRILLIKELVDEGYLLDVAAIRVQKRIEAIDHAFQTLTKGAKKRKLLPNLNVA
uniref:Putative transcriptional regulator n=1 Tax=mine drainage metagenome TaxID=410659 RepID=E6QPS5_9ZZZZ